MSSPLRVFLVEDSLPIRERITDFVEEKGEVDVIGFAETEAEAVQQLENEPVDVAVVDLNLREGTGMGVIASLSAFPSEPRPTIVVFTNHAFPEYEAACMQLGADYFFDKSKQIGPLKDLLHSLHRTKVQSARRVARH